MQHGFVVIGSIDDGLLQVQQRLVASAVPTGQDVKTMAGPGPPQRSATGLDTLEAGPIPQEEELVQSVSGALVCSSKQPADA